MLGITLATVRLATSRVERQGVDRLNGVIRTLGRSSFPYTAAVLTSMKGLSGAEFVALDEAGGQDATSFNAPVELPGWLEDLPAITHINSLGGTSTVSLPGESTRYFAAKLRSSSGFQPRTLLVLYPETVWRQARWEAAWPPLMLGAGSLLLMTAVTTWIAHRISRRIARLEQQVASIAGGDFREIDMSQGRDEGEDEVQDLSRSINQMCRQLREMRETIQRSVRTRLLAQLAAGLAHQLRNSLTGARMSIQLHARRHPVPEGERTLDVALRQLAMTEEHVKGLLSLGRVERGAPVEFELGKLLGDVALLVQASCQHAKVSLELGELIRNPTRPVRLLGDEPGVRAAVLNLVLNAIEAAGTGGRVTLELAQDDREVRVDVRDSGVGPPEELAGSLCEAFVTSKPEGVGLGLALAEQVATEHGGRLSWGRDLGETQFSLTFPRNIGFAEDSPWAGS